MPPPSTGLSSDSDLAKAKRQMRQQMRTRRQRLTQYEQRRAADRLARQLIRLPVFLRSRHIALYWPNDGEIDPRPLAQRAWKMGKHCYLPVLHPLKSRRLVFVRFRPDTALKLNGFGIPEPNLRREPWLPAPCLDLVLLPLVAFDSQGGRLGMGGGFYDSSFAFKQQYPSRNRKPHLVGLAHSCQQTPRVVQEGWDIPLNAVVTERETILAGTGSLPQDSPAD